jgi:hypothetical protein
MVPVFSLVLQPAQLPLLKLPLALVAVMVALKFASWYAALFSPLAGSPSKSKSKVLLTELAAWLTPPSASTKNSVFFMSL